MGSLIPKTSKSVQPFPRFLRSKPFWPFINIILKKTSQIARAPHRIIFNGIRHKRKKYTYLCIIYEWPKWLCALITRKWLNRFGSFWYQGTHPSLLSVCSLFWGMSDPRRGRPCHFLLQKSAAIFRPECVLLLRKICLIIHTLAPQNLLNHMFLLF